MDQKRVFVGIDLGTTNSAIAYIDDHGKAAILPNSDNERITPSVVLFEDDEVIVGKIAKNNSVTAPDRCVQFVKRYMGDPDWTFEHDGHVYRPEAVSAIILKRLVNDAAEALGVPITDAVITVPAYFNDAERSATVDAGRIAGLNVIATLNEPTAAAIAYGIDRDHGEKVVLVYDLGGGTFDVTIIRISGDHIDVLATDGERRLGGKDWDDELMNYLAEKFLDEHGLDPRDDLDANQDLRNKAEEAKVTLSRKPVAKVMLQCQGKSSKIDVTREIFEERTRALLEQTESYLNIVLEKAKLGWKDVDEVLLVGGMSRMPAVEEMLARATGRPIQKGVNPDEGVALGAAYYAAHYAVQHADDNDDAAALASHVPDEIRGRLEGMTVQNVNSHSLGIITIVAGQRKNLVMIPSQTPVPCSRSEYFGTAKDNQTTVKVTVLEGESEDPDDCLEIGECVISNLPPNRPKDTLIKVTYQYNSDGRVEITAMDRETQQQAVATILRESNMTEEQVLSEARAMTELVIE
jgi:molecular chaperone DnaK